MRYALVPLKNVPNPCQVCATARVLSTVQECNKQPARVRN